MKETIVIYKSKYGSAKKYAHWIAENLDADISECSAKTFENINQYENVIYGGSLYAVGILGFDLFKENFNKFQDKKILVYTTGASPATKEALKSVSDNNFTKEIKESVMYVHLRGGFDYKSLNIVDKILMSLLYAKMKMKPKSKLSDDEKGMLESYDKTYDWTNTKSIEPILDYFK